MDEDRAAQGYVAPLLIRKLSGDETAEEQRNSAPNTYVSSLENDYTPRPRFQNFLRASYPFQPPTTPSPTTVTLSLTAGDIILVHSIHTNGWADGTLLETGTRGWLPTNYCEPYDYATMRPLLKAITEFWDIIRNGDEADTGLFHNHDYMRGMVAGVRFLLEKSNCLTRESDLVKQHDSVRKVRKLLLADLSNLVKAAKQMQQLAVNGTDVSQLDETLDDMLLKAFQVVTRGVAFFDCWSEEVALAREISETKSVKSIARRSRASRRSYVLSGDFSSQRESIQSFAGDTTKESQPTPVPSGRSTLTHRMSYTGRPVLGAVKNLASEKLDLTYDAFLGVLASFLGSHMQSRSSSELLLTTHQALAACRQLINVAEVIIEHDAREHWEPLVEAKDAMCDRIADLVITAKQVFRPLHVSDDEMIYLPSEGMQLVSAATACVSCAGRCVAKARMVLEYMGDFEMDGPTGSQHTSLLEANQAPIASSARQETTPTVEYPEGREDSTGSQPGPANMQTPKNSADEELSVPDPNGSWALTPATEIVSPISTSSSEVVLEPTEELCKPLAVSRSSRPFLRDVVHSTGSDTTLVSSTRNSGPSFISNTSTRATSPDRDSKSLPPTPRVDGMEGSSTTDEVDEAENEVMEQRYAHELMFNTGGRVIGGTLNAIVEKLTAHDSTPEPFFVCTIYLTFRLFATPRAFAEALTYRFEYVKSMSRIVGPVRLRVFNIMKCWLESHWRHDSDESVLSYIADFAKNSVLSFLPAAAHRLIELTELIKKTHQSSSPRVLSPIGRTNTSLSDYTTTDQPVPHPVLSRTQLSALRTWRVNGSPISILDFDPLELARQITIKESALFCSILSEELLSTEFTKQLNSPAVNIRAMAQLSTDLANLVADSILILDEPKKRALTVKQWIKIANKCLELNNYDTLMAIICSINSSTILRLKRTWDLVGIKTKNCFEGLKKVVDVSRNYSTLRQRISGHVPPCIPFVGMYLTDLTFVDHGNSDTRELKNGNEAINVINLDKHTKTAKIISDLQRFQTPYRLTEVSELQAWLQSELTRVRAAGERNFQNHYRRSLILEPRETLQSRPTTVGTFASIAGKEKFDFLAWTHISRDKTTPVSS